MFHWSHRSSDRLRALPRDAFSLAVLQMMKLKPGTPWMHLLAELTRKSMPQSATGMSTPPNELIASTMNVQPCALATRATDSMSLSRPEVVSEWIIETWVIDGSLSRISATCAVSGIRSYGSAYCT